MKIRLLAGFGLAIVLVAAMLWIWRGSDDAATGTTGQSNGAAAQDGSGRQVLYWYDPMVPAQRFERPGKSPFMDMQLVPKYADEGEGASVRISAAVEQNLGMRVVRAERERFGDSINAVGRIEADERRLHELPSRVSGYVERLLVRAAGDPVSSGKIVAEIYSPELLSAQREFLALAGASDLRGGASLVEAARQRLRLLGMAEREIQAVTASGQAQTRFGMYAPADGFVTELRVREGAQIAAGVTLMSISDLSSVWLIAEVAEREAGRIGPGAQTTAQLEGMPAEELSGAVDYIYPTLNAATRTIRVRIIVPNKRNALRPGMYASARIMAAAREVLAVPSEAVIYTGSRSLVIVKQDSAFRPVEVQTGAEHNGRTEILQGLETGEQVVTSGQFLIDSEASLSGVLARLSRAAPPEASDASLVIESVAPEAPR